MYIYTIACANTRRGISKSPEPATAQHFSEGTKEVLTFSWT